MKKIFLPIALLAVFTAGRSQSQKAFALTATDKGGYQWNQIRQVDLATGQAGELLFNGNTMVTRQMNGIQVNTPSLSQSAALAYDQRNDRLYFTPMFQPGVLRYMDLSSKDKSIVDVTFSQEVTIGGDPEATNFTRMVIGADGSGYAITNDGNTFVRFNTGKKAGVENLGGLIDDEKNGTISIHNKCSSWGGDMIADAYGSLYIISIRQNVFKVNPATRVATLLGQIQGLPADFTCNGAAVNAEGKVVLSSAVLSKSYFTVDLNSLKAEPLAGNDVYNASDLATSNLYLQAEVDSKLNKMVTIEPKVVGNDKISVYPNPVTDSRITVSFDKVGAGAYTIDLTDQAGKTVARRQVTVNAKGQSVVMNAESKLAKGMYFVKVTDAGSRQVFSSPVIVQ
jgi:hypothetical protein